MKQKIGNQFVLVMIKSILITLIVFIFVGLIFLVMDRGQRHMTGNQLAISQNEKGVVVDWYGDMYQIDTSWWEKADQWLKEHWVLIPRPIRVIDYFTQLFN